MSVAEQVKQTNVSANDQNTDDNPDRPQFQFLFVPQPSWIGYNNLHMTMGQYTKGVWVIPIL